MAYPQARLYKSAESIGAAYEPSASAAMRELEHRSGVTVVVLAPYGGSRTDAEGWAINPYLDPRLSDHNYRKGRAIDVNNRGDITSGLARREGITFGSATLLYYRIWAKYGWRNIQISGDPFPTEPWHMANHSSTPAGSAGVPLPGAPAATTTNGDQDMRVLYNTDTAVADDKKRWLLGELSAQQITADQSTRERKFWGDPVNVSPGELAATIVLVNQRRAALGLPVVVSPGDIDEAALAAALGPLLASDADLAAAVTAIQAAIPPRFTPAEIADAVRDEIIAPD